MGPTLVKFQLGSTVPTHFVPPWCDATPTVWSGLVNVTDAFELTFSIGAPSEA